MLYLCAITWRARSGLALARVPAQSCSLAYHAQVVNMSLASLNSRLRGSLAWELVHIHTIPWNLHKAKFHVIACYGKDI